MPAGTVTPDKLQITVGLRQQGVAARALLETHEELPCSCSGTLLNVQALCELVKVYLWD